MHRLVCHNSPTSYRGTGFATRAIGENVNRIAVDWFWRQGQQNSFLTEQLVYAITILFFGVTTGWTLKEIISDAVFVLFSMIVCLKPSGVCEKWKQEW